MTDIKLERYELVNGSDVGKRRWTSSLGSPLHNDMNPKDGWAYNIEGALGELVFAKFLNVYWPGSVDTFQTQPDVAGCEIKTRSEHWHDLIVREADIKDGDNDKAFVLVTGHSSRNDFQVRGWITAGEAQRSEWWAAHGGRPAAWFVPASALHTDWEPIRARAKKYA